MILPWGLVAWLLARPAAPPVQPAPTATLVGRTAADVGWRRGAAAPWGVLDRLEIQLEPPDTDLSPESCRTQLASWIFPGHSRGQVDRVLLDAALQRSEYEALLSRLKCDRQDCVIAPTLETLISLKPEARGVIYRRLSRYPHNGWALYGFRRRSEQVAHWFDRSGLSPPLQDVLRRLMWDQGEVIAFSDLGAACAQVSSAEDKIRIVKALSRTPALMARLHVDSTSDLDRLTSYWGLDARRKQVRPLLEATSALPGGSTLDVVHLLPPLARKRLYTYPSPHDPPWDCHWTSANFHLEEPSDRFLEGEHFPDHLRSEYREVPLGERRFGDVLTYLRDDMLIHSAVYIADDIVFTKNGQTSRFPWILMTMQDVANLYSLEHGVRIEVHRRK